jgi:hypothetical protein
MVASLQLARQPNAFHTTCQDVKALCAQGRLKEDLDILNAIGYPIDFSTYVTLSCRAALRRNLYHEGN